MTAVAEMRERYPRDNVFSLAVSPDRTLSDIHALLDDNERLDAEIARLHEALRDTAIRTTDVFGRIKYACRLCAWGPWKPRSDHERHAPGCLAAPRDSAADSFAAALPACATCGIHKERIQGELLCPRCLAAPREPAK